MRGACHGPKDTCCCCSGACRSLQCLPLSSCAGPRLLCIACATAAQQTLRLQAKSSPFYQLLVDRPCPTHTHAHAHAAPRPPRRASALTPTKQTHGAFWKACMSPACCTRTTPRPAAAAAALQAPQAAPRRAAAGAAPGSERTALHCTVCTPPAALLLARSQSRS